MWTFNFVMALSCIIFMINRNVEASGGRGSDAKGSNQFPLLGASSRMLYVEQPWSTSETRKHPSGGISAKCMELLDGFTNATTSYLGCIMTNARPLHYCENCVSEFTTAINAFNLICADDENGTTCRDQLLRADNVQVVLLVDKFVGSIWDKSHCHNCYNATVENGTTIYSPTKETTKMLEKIQKVQDCFHDFGGDHFENISVCDMCSDFYVDANIYYNGLDDQNKLCSDLEDSMNYTRRMWSKEFRCDIGVRTNLMIYGIAVAIGFIPVLFYLGSYVVGKREITRRRPSMRSPRRNEEAGHSGTREPINLDDTQPEM